MDYCIKSSKCSFYFTLFFFPCLAPVKGWTQEKGKKNTPFPSLPPSIPLPHTPLLAMKSFRKYKKGPSGYWCPDTHF